MKKEDAIEKLKRQIHLIDNVKSKPRFSSDFTKWKRDTEISIERIFGNDTRHIKDFKNISYSLDYDYERAFKQGLEKGRTILESMIQEIEDYWDENNTNQPIIPALDNIKILCNRFHLFARQLKFRHSSRNTIEINDEYDVQDLFHALLTLYFDDIRDEQWTPSYAGVASRVDFLLKQEQTVIELKKTREKLTNKEIGEQLIVDITRYKSHPDCKTLICFVYDPEKRIKNPRGIENDLSKPTDGLPVKVFIRPL
jgi:REase_DpnII-MboI